MASAKTVRDLLLPAETAVFRQDFRDLLLPAETAVHEKWLPAETVYVIMLPAESQQEARDPGVVAEAKYDGQSLHEVKISKLVYTL